MAGHIVKRSGKKKINGKLESLYYLVYQVNGKQKWEKVPPSSSSPQATRKDADKLLARRLNQIHGGEFIESSNITFEEFKDDWVKKYAKGQVRPTTMDRYRTHFKQHIIPFFGGMQLSDIGVEHIQEFKAVLVDKDLSAGYVKHHLALMRQMLDFAIDWGYIRNNPAKKVKYPTILRQDSDSLSPKEVRLLLKKIPTKWYALFLVAITGGLRIGELLAMRWGNVDWKKGQYYVRETLRRKTVDRPKEFGPTKTLESAQKVDLTPVCLVALKTHRRRQVEEKLQGGKNYVDQDLVFAQPNGRAHDHKNVVNRVFKPALTEAGLRTLRFHDLRHTCATLLIGQKESPKYIQKQLRHASIEITFDRYGHLFPDENKEAAKRLDETLFGTTVVEPQQSLI